MSSELMNMGAVLGVEMHTGSGLADMGSIAGHYDIICSDDSGNIIWEDGFDNVVTTVGQNATLVSGVILQVATAGFMGLISNTGTAAVNASDTMASHAGWVEGGTTNAPTMSSTRQSLAGLFLNPPSAGSTNTTASTFVMTGSGTIAGGFVVMGTGASATVLNTGGILLSAGLLGVQQPVISGNTITMTYTITL